MATGPRIEDAPVDEAARFAESRVAKTCSRVLFGLVIFHSIAVLYLLMVKARALRGVFAEISMELPVCTRMLFILRPLVVAIVFLLLIGGAAKEIAVKERRATLILNAVHLVALVVLKELADLVLFLPLATPMFKLG